MTDVAVKRFISNIVGTNMVRWYQRVIGADKPSAAINEDFVYNPDAVYKANPNVKVAGQSALWIDKGEHPILIRKGIGFIQKMMSFGEAVQADFHGTCFSDLDIQKEDHLVDSNGKEYKVVAIDSSLSGNFKAFSLSYMP